MIVRALSSAGSDPSGGAGIQADLKSFAAHGAYGMAAIASLTAQNTRGVRAVFSPPSEFLAEQLDAISDDITVDAVKIGMLGNAGNIAVVARWLAANRPPSVVLDPVMVATSGDRLLDPAAEQAIRELLPLADVLTPNAAELAVLVGEPLATELDTAIAQGRRLAATTGARVLVKGGHLSRDTATDALVEPTRDGDVGGAVGRRAARLGSAGGRRGRRTGASLLPPVAGHPSVTIDPATIHLPLSDPSGPAKGPKVAIRSTVSRAGRPGSRPGW